jgi:choline-sulfatase
MNDQWEDLEWAVVSAKQRHYLQTQLADRMTGELIDHLQKSNMLDSSMVVVMSDHGFSFRLNDRRRALGEDNAAELLRVPMFIKHPAQITGQRINEPVMTIDLLPTLLASLAKHWANNVNAMPNLI